MPSLQEIERREVIAKELGLVKCEHCVRFCPYCPRLLALRPDLRPDAPNGKPSPRPAHKTTSPHPYPSLWQQAKNVAGAIVEHVTAGLPQVDDETFHRRLSICERCEHFDVKQRRCTICGCLAGIKLWWSEQRCPDKPPRW